MRFAIALVVLVCAAGPATAASLTLKVDRVFHVRSYIHVIIRATNDASRTVNRAEIECSAFDAQKQALGVAGTYPKQIAAGQTIAAEIMIDAPPDAPESGLQAECRVVSVE